MDFGNELDICLRARFTLIIVVTREEERAVDLIKTVCEKRQRPLITWDVADGFVSRTEGFQVPSSSKDPVTALSDIEKAQNDGVYTLLDFHECFMHPTAKRKLRNVAHYLKYTRKSIIVVSPFSEIPEELKDVAVSLELSLPRPEELDQVLEILLKTPGVKSEISEKEREELVQAARGLTAAQAQRVFSRAIVKDGKLNTDDIAVVIDEKRGIIKESESLEYCPVVEGMDHVGGLQVFKEWLQLRSRAFSKEAREYGLATPKGVALIGIPGTGKSLSAKLIASSWHLPLFRLDVGSLFGQYIGQSEERARGALRVAESVSPCVLWIDEIEKSLSQGGHDSGTSSRVVGTILTWMQEKTAPVFVVATANNVRSLPPELLRRGRFDEIFFLDLPTLSEREHILAVHLNKRGRDSEQFNLETLAEASQGYVGAEIEQAIIDAMILAFNQDREFVTEDVLTSLQRQVPLSVSQKEVIQELQEWLDNGRAQPASLHGDGAQERQRLRKQMGFR